RRGDRRPVFTRGDAREPVPIAKGGRFRVRRCRRAGRADLTGVHRDEEQTFPRATYAESGKAQRQATRRAQAVDGIGANGKPIFSRTDWKVLLNVFGLT